MGRKIDPEIKRLAHIRAGGRCERCGKPGSRKNWELHVHHVVTERYGHELLGDVEVVCLACHQEAHPRATFTSRAMQQARAYQRQRRRKKKGSRPSAGKAKKAPANQRKKKPGRWGTFFG